MVDFVKQIEDMTNKEAIDFLISELDFPLIEDYNETDDIVTLGTYSMDKIMQLMETSSTANGEDLNNLYHGYYNVELNINSAEFTLDQKEYVEILLDMDKSVVNKLASMLELPHGADIYQIAHELTLNRDVEEVFRDVIKQAIIPIIDTKLSEPQFKETVEYTVIDILLNYIADRYGMFVDHYDNKLSILIRGDDFIDNAVVIGDGDGVNPWMDFVGEMEWIDGIDLPEDAFENVKFSDPLLLAVWNDDWGSYIEEEAMDLVDIRTLALDISNKLASMESNEQQMLITMLEKFERSLMENVSDNENIDEQMREVFHKVFQK